MSILLKNAPAIHIAPDGKFPVDIPPTAFTFEGFREWTRQEGQFPEKGKIEYILGEIWIDMSPERLGSHSAVREAIGRALGDLVQRLDMGTVIPDGSRVVNVKAELACEPDLTFVSWESEEQRLVELSPTVDGKDFWEIVGSPDMVLEVVSPSSLDKDRKKHPKAYFRAGIQEYWIADCRSDEIDFQILGRGARKFTAAESLHGWQKSEVFGHWFRLTRTKNRRDRWTYQLEVKKRMS